MGESRSKGMVCDLRNSICEDYKSGAKSTEAEKRVLSGFGGIGGS